MSNRTIFNELGESRVINPRSGFSQFVDLSNNQTISGIKRFLSNLITNSNVNFNTTANVGRIVFKPNEPAGILGYLLSVYTQDQNDGQGWIFDAYGNLFYTSNDLIPIQTVFSPNGYITITNDLTSYGLIQSPTANHNEIFPYGGGTTINCGKNWNWLLSSGVNRIKFFPTVTTAAINNIIEIYRVGDDVPNDGFLSFDNTGLLKYNFSGSTTWSIDALGNISTPEAINCGSLVTNLINANTFIGYNPSIYLDNRFIDVNNSSLDIIATYIGFASPTQTLTTASKYMYIKPLSTGDFEIRINNISNKVLATDWSQLATATQMNTTFYSTAGVLMGFINPNPPAGVSSTMRIMGTSNQYIYYNTSNNFGNYNSTTSVVNWEIFNNGNFATIGAINSNTINSNTGTTISSSSIWNYKSPGGTTYILLDPTLSATNRLQIYSEVGYTKYLYFNTSNVLGFYTTAGVVNNIWSIDGGGNILTIGNINNGAGNITTTGNINGGIITGTSLSAGSGTISTTGSISGVGITGRTLDLKNASAITNITLDATTTSGDRLKIYGIASGTKYLYYNTSNNIGVFNTSTGTSVWSIDGTTGNIVTIGSYSVGSLSATSFLCNSMSPLSGTTITFGITSNCNWLKSAGVNRILMFPSSTSGDIMQICRVGNTSYTSGYWYFNNSGNLGYNTSGVTVWELLNTGGLVLNNDLVMANTGYSIFCNTWYAQSYSTYRNVIRMNQLFTNTSISSMSLCSQYIDFIHPSITPTISSKYMFIVPDTGGNFTQYINNISGRVLQTDWSNLILRTDYNFQTLGKYNYIAGEQTGSVCGHWSERTDPFGKPITNNSNSWVTMGGMNNNNFLVIGGGYPNAGSSNRMFTWLIENTVNSGKALGLACNRTNSPYTNINDSTQATGFILLGHFATNRGAGAAYSFTGEHSSMVCDEEYNDIMNYNTDDFIGMVVCSSGKIYNLPYDVDGNTNEKQVDNIKPIDAQPMTKLSKKYKDKSVLGVISHIEKIGKDRNNITGGSWTAAISLDKDERRRIRIASIGEGGIWITNEYGNIENGDYITTSKIAGYSTKQDDDLMHNYTIAKATMDCVFDIEKPDEYKTKYLGDGIYASYIACVFYCG